MTKHIVTALTKAREQILRRLSSKQRAFTEADHSLEVQGERLRNMRASLAIQQERYNRAHLRWITITKGVSLAEDDLAQNNEGWRKMGSTPPPPPT